MLKAVRIISAACVCAIGGCAGLPTYDLTGDSSRVAPAGPKVASLVANLKCELWQAVNSTQVLPRYADSPRLHTINSTGSVVDSDAREPVVTGPEREFTLKNYFDEIEYVADAAWTLDVTFASSFNPSLNGNKYFRGPEGVFPATGALLSVGGAVSDSGHRFVTIYQALDLTRLSRSTRPEDKPNDQSGLARNLADCANTDPQTAATPPNQGAAYRSGGSDLQGDLGLRETLATAIIAASMSDISLLPPLIPANADDGKIGADKKKADRQALANPLVKNDGDSSGQYTFGIITVQVDFTVVQSVSLGANWTLRFFSLPNPASPSLLGASRTVKDQLVITFVPVCIRRKYSLHPSQQSLNHLEYIPLPMDGSPPWMNYLLPCDPTDGKDNTVTRAAKATRSLAIGRSYNLLRLRGGPFTLQ